jgi:hypothetical protein
MIVMERPISKAKRICKHCGKDFFVWPSQIAWKPCLYCSKSCASISRSNNKGRMKSTSGYVLVLQKNHPHKDKAGYVREHRLIMETVIGRYLSKDEAVHHINGIKDDNRKENLQLLSISAHCEIHRRRENTFKLLTLANL